MRRNLLLFVVAAIPAGAGCGKNAGADSHDGGSDGTGSIETPLRESPEADTAAPPADYGRYQVVELTFAHATAALANPWEEVRVAATFTSPSGDTIDVGGFYYGPDTYKVRFAPVEIGTYGWTVTLADSTATDSQAGSFTVGPAAAGERGFVRPNPANPHQWVFDDGTAFHPVGFGDCVRDWNNTGDPLTQFGLDETFVDVDKYFGTYGAAGFDLFRFSVDNCAFKLWEKIDPAGNRYLEREGIWADRLVRSLRQHGFRVYMVAFGFVPLFATDTSDSPRIDALRRYLRYVVDRWGAYVDFWELMNEANATSYWIGEAAAAVRTRDPYGHRIATSWSKPAHASVEIDAPHWYQKESELDSDRLAYDGTRSHLASWGKPVIYGEQGNAGTNWDPGSGLRMRLRSWAAFMAEGVLVFWNTSSTKMYKHAVAANVYLGPEERGYIRVLQDFTARAPADALPTPVTTSRPTEARGYALRGASWLGAYFTNPTAHDQATRDVTVTLDVPAAGKARFIAPATGATLGSVDVAAGMQTIALPEFTVDSALEIRP